MRFTTAALVALPLLGSGLAAPVAAPEHQEDKRLLGGLLGGLFGGGQPALPSLALPSLALPSALPTGGLLPGLLGPSGIIDGTVVSTIPAVISGALAHSNRASAPSSVLTA